MVLLLVLSETSFSTNTPPVSLQLLLLSYLVNLQSFTPFCLIANTALQTSGAAGLSGLDAYARRRLCTAFHSASTSLCQSLAEVAKRLCSALLDPMSLAPFLACRLIALDKCPGVRPIGIGETVRRIIARAVLVITRGDIQDAAGSTQLCAGQIAGCEAAVHSVRERFWKMALKQPSLWMPVTLSIP